MRFLLDFDQTVGWTLKHDLTELKCSICGKKLDLPFYFCKEYGQFFCVECETGNKYNVTVHASVEGHEHQFIRRVELILDSTKKEVVKSANGGRAETVPSKVEDGEEPAAVSAEG